MSWKGSAAQKLGQLSWGQPRHSQTRILTQFNAHPLARPNCNRLLDRSIGGTPPCRRFASSQRVATQPRHRVRRTADSRKSQTTPQTQSARGTHGQVCEDTIAASMSARPSATIQARWRHAGRTRDRVDGTHDHSAVFCHSSPWANVCRCNKSNTTEHAKHVNVDITARSGDTCIGDF
jgi:hypothetical protein